MDLQVLTTKQARAAFDAQAVLDRAKREDRDLTDGDRKEHETKVKDVESLSDQILRCKSDDAMLRAITDLTGVPMDANTPVIVGRFGRAPSMGEQFTNAEEFKAWHKNGRNRTGAFTSPTIEIKGTLTEEPASGGGLVLPQYQPGIMPLPLQPPAVIDLLAPGSTESNAVGYMAEKTYTNAAAPTAEGALKPESTLVFEAVTDPVRKIAHWLPASEEILDDVRTLRSYIDARLRLGVRAKFDDQLLNGDGTGVNILGLLHRVGLAAAVVRGASETNADAILRQIMAIATATNLMPDGIVIHPTNWAEILLMKTGTNEYIGDGPFMAIQRPTLWGLPVSVTSAIALGTALVGSFRGAAQLFLRGPIAVAATNSHADFFVKNLVAIRAEQRGALAVYRPAAFGTVTGLGPVIVTP